MPQQLARSLSVSSRTQQATSATRLARRSKALAAACAVESLEARQLFSMSVGVNFQPSGSTIPSGYLKDSGAVFASRGNGYTYGWNGTNTSTRDRNLMSDQRYDTTIHTQSYGVFQWEMAVPNGLYRVRAVAGDAGFSDGDFRFNVEGRALLNGVPTDSSRFVEGTALVNVTDGRLTISNAAGSVNNKLCFVDIASIDVPAVAGVTYLSDLTPTSATNGWGSYEKDMSNGERASRDGRVLNLGGTTYQKGLGVHANSSLVYNLAGRYQTFKADIGIDKEASSTGSVVFQVLADGQKIYDSGLMTTATAKKSLALAVAGVAQLTLVVSDGGNGIGLDHADWANAHLVASNTTPTVPAAPSNLAATALSSTQVKLTWSDNSANETGFRVERSADGTTFTSLATVGAGTVTYTDATAAASTAYTYRVVAANAAGNSPASNLATVTTPAPSPSVPAAPSNLVATALSSTQVKLTWTDGSSNETGFKVERSTDGTTFASLATVGAGVATYTDTTAAAATRYIYRVSAYNTAGTSPASNTATVTTPATTPSVTANYVVSTTGSDSANGSSATPFRTVAKAMSVAQAGDVILVRNGTYSESLSLTRSGAAGKPITLMGESTSGVVFDGTGRPTVLVANGAQYITIANLTFRHAANGPQNYQAAVRTGSNWTLQDIVVEKMDGTAICAKGSNVTLLRVIAQDNGVAGIGSDGANGLLVKDCITRRNNTGLANPVWKGQTSIDGWPAAMQVNGIWYMNPDFEAGGGKYWQSNNVTIDGLQAYENIGPGIWFDVSSTNVNIRNCKSFNNRGIDSSHKYQGNGIRLELQDVGPFMVENNLIYGNTGQPISIEKSRNITIRNNTLVGGAVLFRDASTRVPISNITVTGNRIKNGFFETWEGTWNTSSGSSKDIVIDGNTYDNGSGQLFYWAKTSYSSLSTIRSVLGFEATGKLGTVTY